MAKCFLSSFLFLFFLLFLFYSFVVFENIGPGKKNVITDVFSKFSCLHLLN